MCLLIAQLIIGFFSFFLLRPFTVLMKQTRQAVRAIKQSIFLDVYALYLTSLWVLRTYIDSCFYSSVVYFTNILGQRHFIVKLFYFTICPTCSVYFGFILVLSNFVFNISLGCLFYQYPWAA